MKSTSKIDHKNNNGLDNRKCNLRIATIAQNAYNRRTFSDSKSGYKGVTQDRHTRQWYARIKYQRKAVLLGVFDEIEQAAEAYDEAARRLFGEFARLNFPKEGESGVR